LSPDARRLSAPTCTQAERPGRAPEERGGGRGVGVLGGSLRAFSPRDDRPL